MTEKLNGEIAEIQKQTELYCGKNYQRLLWCEELGELVQAISKYYRNISLSTYNNLIEEMADVTIILEEIKASVGISDIKIEEVISEKIKRTKERLKRAQAI